MTTLLRAEGIHVDLAGRTILRDVDLELRRGEVTSLIGPNGAGKTTLLEILAGLDTPSRGAVERAGTVAAALQGASLAHRTATQNVELALAWWGVPRSARRARAHTALDLLGAREFADQPARTLSGGEARRVHLARALAVEPDILLLDEPFAGLDVATRAELLYAAQEAIRSERRATLVVVHDRAEAWALADRVVVLLDGGVVSDGPPADVFQRPATLEVARFVGYVGTIVDGDHVIALRPTDVRLERTGRHVGRVRGRVPIEDGVRLEVEVGSGAVVAIAEAPGPQLGAEVHLSVVGGARFARPT